MPNGPPPISGQGKGSPPPACSSPLLRPPSSSSPSDILTALQVRDLLLPGAWARATDGARRARQGNSETFLAARAGRIAFWPREPSAVAPLGNSAASTMTEVAGEKEQTGEGQGEEEGRNGGMANGTRGVIARARKMRSTGGADREHEEEGGERGGPKFPPVAFDGCFFLSGCRAGSALRCLSFWILVVLPGLKFQH